MPVIGTPRSSALCTVQRPVPFCSAWSGTMSTNGLPVSASVWASTSAVISIRNDSRSPSFHSPEDLGESRPVGVQAAAQQVVGLGDQLHVGVLDAVVHHLHEVPGAVRADVHAARRAVDLGRDRLEDRAELVVGLLRAARHDARPVQRALLAAGDAGADEVQAAARVSARLAAAGVGEVRVAAVDDDVALLQQRDQLVDHGVGRLAGLDHDDDRARLLERRDEVGQVSLGMKSPSSPCSSISASVRPWLRLCTATCNPLRARFRARLRPITARPVTPISAPTRYQAWLESDVSRLSASVGHRKPGNVAGELGVADEGDGVHQGVGDDERHNPLPPQEEPAEDEAHREVRREAAEALVEVVAAAYGRGRHQRPDGTLQPS